MSLPQFAGLAGRTLIAAAVAGLVVSAATAASDTRLRKIRCYGLDPAAQAVQAQIDATAQKEGKPKPKKKKKDYKVMRAQDCAVAGGRPGEPD